MRTRIVWVAVFLAAACTLAPAGEPTNLLPNGGFEFTGRFAQEWLAEYSKQAGVKDFDPVVPIGWLPAFNPGVTYELSGNAHGGKKSLHVVVPKNAGGQIAQQAIEVAPRATYTFGLWCKGSGQCHMRIIGLAFEGGQELASKDITAGAQWSRTTQTVEIPGHIRMVRVEIGIDSGSDLLLDDVFFAAELDGPFDADAALAAKWQADADTLLLVDFSGHGPEVKLENGAAIVEGGPFGKCLHLDRKQMSVANVSLGVKKMPPEGTLEFWLSLDEVPQLSPKTAGTQQSYLQMHSGDTDVLRFTTAYGQIYGSWRVTGGTWDPESSIEAPEWAALRWFRKGQFNHVAVEWDAQAVRLYVNGMLVNYETKHPLPFFQTPSGITLGPHRGGYSWSGAFGGLRLSSIKRYGPKVPKGVQWVAIPVPADDPPKAAPAAVGKPPADAAAQRARIIAPIPDAPPGSIAFDATQIHPLVDGDKSFAIEKDQPVAGMTTALVGKGFRLMRDPDFDGGYWKLSGVKPGRYYVGVWHSSGQWTSQACLYLNGRVMQCSTRSDPVQVKAGEYFAESQTADAVETQGRRRDMGPAAAWRPIPRGAADALSRTHAAAARAKLGVRAVRGHLVPSRHGHRPERGRQLPAGKGQERPKRQRPRDPAHRPALGPAQDRRRAEGGRAVPDQQPPAADDRGRVHLRDQELLPQDGRPGARDAHPRAAPAGPARNPVRNHPRLAAIQHRRPRSRHARDGPAIGARLAAGRHDFLLPRSAAEPALARPVRGP